MHNPSQFSFTQLNRVYSNSSEQLQGFIQDFLLVVGGDAPLRLFLNRHPESALGGSGSYWSVGVHCVLGIKFIKGFLIHHF